MRYLSLLVCSPLFAFVLHLLIARLIRLFKLNLSPLLVAAFSVLIGYFVMGAITWQISLKHLTVGAERFWAVVYGLLVYSGLAFSYFQFFGMSETARRIHILYELNMHGGTTRSEIHSRYRASDMLSVRLERLIAWRQLKVVGGRFVLHEARFLYYAAKLMDFWARALGFQKKTSQ